MCLTSLMIVLLWNSLTASMILLCSGPSAQETVQCQFMSEFAPVLTVKMPLCSLGITRPGQKISGLSSKGAVCSHRAVQNRTVKEHFYLGTMRRVRDAVRRNDQEMAVCCVANHNAPLHLAQFVQPMLAKQHIQQVRQPQNSPHTAACEFLLFPALSTL